MNYCTECKYRKTYRVVGMQRCTNRKLRFDTGELIGILWVAREFCNGRLFEPAPLRLPWWRRMFTKRERG